MARPWTKLEELQLRQLDRSSVGCDDIARCLGRSVNAVWNRLSALRREGYVSPTKQQPAPRPSEQTERDPTRATSDAVIRRCTRDGRVLWHHVAQQMGTSVARARSQYDPTYARSQDHLEAKAAA